MNAPYLEAAMGTLHDLEMGYLYTQVTPSENLGLCCLLDHLQWGSLGEFMV